jgi:two-component system C4-dicarboxylate transport sensor histidine kinase DctB
VEGLLHAPEDRQRQQAANDYLERLSQRTGASAIYIMDSKGVVRATSNWRQPDSYLGENDAFRAYFTDAMSGQPGRFFGVGTTRSEAGYYLSEPLSSHGRIIGVAVVKVNMEYLEKLWRENKTTVMVSDQNGVVILATEPGWKFSTLKPFSKALQDAFDRNLQYNRKRLLPLGLEERRSLGNGSHIYRLDQAAASPQPAGLPARHAGPIAATAAVQLEINRAVQPGPVYQLAYNRGHWPQC